MGSRQLSSRFTGSRRIILLNGFQTIVQQIFTGSRWVILLNGFQTIVQQIHRESPGYSSQRVLDYCSVDSLGVAGLFFATGQRLLSSRYSQGVAGYSSKRFLDYCPVEIHRESLGFFLNGFSTIVEQIHREPLGYSSQWVQDNCPVDSQGVDGLFFSTDSRLLSSRYSQGVAGLFFSTGSRLLSSRFTGSRRVILLSGFQTIVQQIHWESLGYSSQRFLDYCPVDSQGVPGLFFSMGSRLLSSRFAESLWVILLNGFSSIVQQIHRKSLGYSSQRFPDYCPVDIQMESLCYSSQRVLDYCPVDSQGVAGLFFSTGCRLLSSRFTGSRWFILLNGFQTIAQQLFTGSRWVILLNGFQTIVQQILRESLGYSSQRVLDYCPVDSQEVPGLFFSAGSRILSSRFTGSRWVILLNGFQSIVQQIHRKSLGYSSQRVPDYCPVDIHRESLCYSSQRVLDYCPVDSQGVAGLFFSTGSRLLSSRFTGSRWFILPNGFQTIVQQLFTGSRWVILLNGFQTIVKQIHRESLFILLNGFQTIVQQRFTGRHWVILLNGFQTIVQQIFTGSRWVILLNGLQIIVHQISTVSCWVILLNWFQTIVKQIHRESLGYSSQRFLDYCPVEIHRESLAYSSQQVLDYCPLDIHRESLGYSSQQVLDYCPIDLPGVAGLFFSTGSRLFSSRYSQGVVGFFFSTDSRLLSSRFTGSRWVILLNGFKTIVQSVRRESLGYSSQRVLDYCPVDIHRESLVILFSGFQAIVQQRFTGSRWVFFLNGFQTIAKQIHREPLGYFSQWVQDNCPVDSQGFAGLFFSTDCRLLSSRFTGSRRVILLSGFQTIVQQIHWESLGYSSQQVRDYCPVDIHRESLVILLNGFQTIVQQRFTGSRWVFFSTGSRLLSSRFTGSRWVILLNGFKTIVQ